MRRFQLFEWEDQPWLPRVLRDFITDHLRYTHTEAMRLPVNKAIARQLAAVVTRTGSPQIVDLCAGAGGPVLEVSRLLADELGRPIPIVVTDLFPNRAAFERIEQTSEGAVRARFEPTDATNVPGDLPGLRTIFTALHHFPPPLAAAVLADAGRKRSPIAVFEPLERTWRMVFLVGLMSFLRGFTHTHRVGQMTAGRFCLTYLLPLAPAAFAWDGAVSALRSYTAAELSELAERLSVTGFTWEAGRFEVDGPYGSMPTTYLIGVPQTV